MILKWVHPLLLRWAGDYIHLREVTTACAVAATGLLPGSRRRQTPTPGAMSATSWTSSPCTAPVTARS